MEKIKSLSELIRVKTKVEAEMNLRTRSECPENYIQVKVFMGDCGIASGAKSIVDYLIRALEKAKVEALVMQTECIHQCEMEPMVEVKKPNESPVIFGHVNTSKADEIVEKYILKGELLSGMISPDTLLHNTI